MSDRRLTPANSRVVARDWDGQSNAQEIVDPVQMRVLSPVADILAAPGGMRDRQLLFGAEFETFETRDGYAFGRSLRDGYCGYVRADKLGQPVLATHRVSSQATHVYSMPDFKSAERMFLPFGSLISARAQTGRFLDTGHGYLPLAHLEEAEVVHSNPVANAARFLGVPYLWGGNSTFGIDCSGLVQAAFHLAGVDCPGDSDLQMAAVEPVEVNAPPAKGDLMFWKGHVAMIADDRTLIHANAFHMAVVLEPIREAIARIKAQGDGDVIARGRLI